MSSRDHLADLDEPLRHHRINEAQALCIHAAADRDRAVSSGTDVVAFDLFANSLFDGLAGFLAAPVSLATARRLRDFDGTRSPRLRLLSEERR